MPTVTIGAGPSDNPGAQPALVEMWRNNLRKSMQQIPGPPIAPTALVITMDGVAQPLVVGHAGILPIPFPCRILGCRIYAGVFDATLGPQPIAASATINLRLGHAGSWTGGSQPLYATGTMPTLTAAPEADVSISGWITELQPGDILPYSLATFAGTATFLVLTLNVLRLDVTGLGASELSETASGDSFTDSNGQPFVIRG